MSWFQLDPSSIAERVRNADAPASMPSLANSVIRGVVGFTVVSVAGFVPWAVFGRWFYRQIGEAGLYAVCAVVFVGLSGPLLHRLIIGPGSLSRFYKVFTVAFSAYSVAWIVGWMSLRGHAGSLAGLFAGTAVMGAILAAAFEVRGVVAAIRIVAALFILNALGYFVGGWFEEWLMPARGAKDAATQATLAKLQWGLWYGIGFGAGLGLAFHLCQARVRALLAAEG